MAKRLIGTATTDAQGVATVSYVGEGAGVLNIQAELDDGSLQSEIYEIIDAMFSDLGTSDKSSSYTLSNVVYAQTDNYISLTNATGGTRWVRVNVGGSSSYLDNQTDYCIEIDVKNINSTQLAIVFDGTSVNVKDYVSTSDFTHIKIYSSRSENKVYYVIDDVTRNVNASNVTGNVQLRVGNNEGYSFKNFMIYPI